MQRVGVTGQSQRGYIGVQAVDDGAGLLARAAVRLLDTHVLPGFAFPVLGKGLVEFGIQLAGRVIRDVEQGDRGRGLGHSAQTREGHGHDGGQVEKAAFDFHRVIPEMHIRKLMGWILRASL